MSHTKMALNEKTTLQPNTTTPADVGVRTGLEFQRYFTDGRTSPFDTVEWERRVAQIGNEKGKVIFRQEDVEVPKGWSQTATNIVAVEIFSRQARTPETRGPVSAPTHQHVVNRDCRLGRAGRLLRWYASRDAFRDALTHLLFEQKMAFNSPVWFNIGVQPKPQCSACFHQLRPGRHGIHHEPGQDQGMFNFTVGLEALARIFFLTRQPRKRFPAAASPPGRSAS